MAQIASDDYLLNVKKKNFTQRIETVIFLLTLSLCVISSEDTQSAQKQANQIVHLLQKTKLAKIG